MNIDQVKELIIAIEKKDVKFLNQDIIEEFYIDQDEEENIIYFGVRNEQIYGDGIVDFEFNFNYLESYKFSEDEVILELFFLPTYISDFELSEVKITFKK